MFLTKMPINRRRRGAGKLLSYPEAMHAAVESAFAPSALADAGGRALWRVDSPLPDETNLYVVSPVEPDMSHIVEQAGWQTGTMWQTRSYAPLLDHLDEGSAFAFRLRANPVHHGRPDPSLQTKPTAHRTVKHQEAWLLDRAERNGFSIPDGPQSEAQLRVVERGTLRFEKSSGHRVTLAFATFEGVLTVRNPDLMRSMLVSGLGRGKAYGCGLMTLAPIQG